MPKEMTYSLRLRLLGLISIPILLAICIIGTIAAYSAYHEIDEVYDAQLSHAAKVLLQLTEHEVKEHESYEIELGAERQGMSHRYENNLTFRIWKKDHLVTESQGAISFDNLRAPPGFSDQLINEELWRFFVLVDYHTGITVEVAEKYHIRTELILQILISFFTPTIIFIPLFLFLIWWGTTKSLKPLLYISRAMDKRDVNDLTPIKAKRVPKEITPLMKALNNMLQRLNTSLIHEREFTDNAAHELRTPLAAMKTQTQVLIKKVKDAPDCQEGLDNLLQSIDRASHMVAQLLSLSRLQSQNVDFDEVNLSSLTQSTVTDLSPLAMAKKQELSADIQEDIVIKGNQDALSVMIRNLIDNAIKYTNADGNINVSLQTKKSGHVLTITDNGPGIADHEKTSVWERFKRGKNTSSEGSGLGLAIVKWVANMHHAELVMRDNEPRGLTLQVIFHQ
jgi:two-component system sensor histidine kinase QseC